MSAEDMPGDLRSLLSLRTIPVYSIFALWSLGTGAQQMARPLFAASFGVPAFLVTVIAATNSLAWMITAPATTDAFADDRIGNEKTATCVAISSVGAIGLASTATRVHLLNSPESCSASC